MSTNDAEKRRLVDEINHLLEQSGSSVVPIVRKALRLAHMCDEPEYRLLLDIHLDGVDPSKASGLRVESWPDITVQPKWNPVNAFFEDRHVEGKGANALPLEQLEQNRLRLLEELNNPALRGSYQGRAILIEPEQQINQILIRIRNRVGTLVRLVEADLNAKDASTSVNSEKDTVTTITTTNEKPIPNVGLDRHNVFVVHGRNLEVRDSLFRFLRSIGLRPLEWSQAITLTGKASPFIGEILDAAFSNAQAVVVLLTPDDEARLHLNLRSSKEPSYETDLTGQARPNVLFEAGMSMGRYPDRTIILELGNLRPFSDIAGRHTIRLNNTPAARQELAQRLQVAGCPVDLSGRHWHTEGNFALEDHSNAIAVKSATGKTGANLVCLNARLTSLVTENWTFRELEDCPQLKDYAYSAAILEFENQLTRERRVEPLDTVEAQIVFYDSEGRELYCVESGAWVGESANHTAFEVGRRKKLLIAFKKSNRQESAVWTAQNNRNTPDSTLKPNYLKLAEAWLRVYVRLVSHGEVIKEENLELIVTPSTDPSGWVTIRML